MVVGPDLAGIAAYAWSELWNCCRPELGVIVSRDLMSKLDLDYRLWIFCRSMITSEIPYFTFEGL